MMSCRMVTDAKVKIRVLPGSKPGTKGLSSIKEEVLI